MNKNEVYLKGTIDKEAKYSHKVYGEKFFEFFLSVERLSGTVDSVPVTVSERVIEAEKLKKGGEICILGQFRSYNKLEKGKSSLKLHVFAYEVVQQTSENVNIVDLVGYLCKPPTYRETPLGREVADLLIAVNRNNGKSDYIPCIVWGRNARFAKHIKVGDKLTVFGRIQSRIYQKATEKGIEERTAYEVSASKITVDFDSKKETA